MNVDPQELVFHKILRVSRAEFDADTESFSAMVDQEMRQSFAHHIQRAKIEKEFGEFYVEARLDLYVATPEEFWALVNFQAERIANQFGMTIKHGK